MNKKDKKILYIIQKYVQEHPCECGAFYPRYYWSFQEKKYKTVCQECDKRGIIEIEELTNYVKEEGIGDFIE